MTLARSSFLPLVRSSSFPSFFFFFPFPYPSTDLLDVLALLVSNSNRSSPEDPTKSTSPLVLKSETTLPSFETLVPSSSSTANASRMESSLSSRRICTWSRSWRLGTIWFVLRSPSLLAFLLPFFVSFLEVYADLFSLVLLRLVQGILNEVWKHKLIFVETPDAAETSIALENYRKVSRCVPLLPS